MRNTINDFVFDFVSSMVVSAAPPELVNVRRLFQEYVGRVLGFSEARAAEIADEQLDHVLRRLEEYLVAWDKQGVPRPLVNGDRDHVYLVWKHKSFASYSGLRESLDANYCELFDYVAKIDPKGFLLICALWLKVSGFKRILICDGKGDEGVDLLGVMGEGGLRSLVTVVQAKTSREPITRGVVLAEFGKYRMLPHTDKFLQYRRALGVDGHEDGVSWTFVIVANQPFKWSAKEASSRLGVLLRSIHQIVFAIGKHYEKTWVEKEVRRLGEGLVPSLTRDYARAFRR